MSGRWTDLGGGGDSSQDFTQATQEESALGETLTRTAVGKQQLSSISLIHAQRRSFYVKLLGVVKLVRWQLGRFSWGDSTRRVYLRVYLIVKCMYWYVFASEL